MKLFNARSAILSVAKRWESQYRTAQPGDSAHAITVSLHALNPATATAAEVNKIIGNDSWTTRRCCDCNTYVESGIELGRDDPVNLCVMCAKVVGAASAIL